MNLIKAAFIRRTMTPAQRAFLDEKQIEATMTPEEWAALLGPVASYDRQITPLLRLTRKAWPFLLFSIFLSGCFTIGIDFPAGLIVVTAALIVLLVVDLVAMRILGRINVSDNVGRFVLPMLAVLRQDLAPGTPVEMRLDIRGAVEEKKVEPPGYLLASGWRNDEYTCYDDPWIDGMARLADGTILRWRVVSQIAERKRTKTNARGKTKVKFKHKAKHRMRVRLAASKKRYALANGAPDAADAKRHVIKTEGAVKKKGADRIDDETLVLDPDPFLAVVAQAYRRLQPLAA